MKWITRERPKIDRIACPWLIKNFVDDEAEFIYVPKDKVLEKAKELAKKFNRHSLPSLSRIKTAVNEGMNRTLSEGLELEAELFEEVFQTEDIKEGVSAFIEKRPAVFSHK